jgi:DNA mismatch repair ATPase MutL
MIFYWKLGTLVALGVAGLLYLAFNDPQLNEPVFQSKPKSNEKSKQSGPSREQSTEKTQSQDEVSDTDARNESSDDEQNEELENKRSTVDVKSLGNSHSPDNKESSSSSKRPLLSVFSQLSANGCLV